MFIMYVVAGGFTFYYFVFKPLYKRDMKKHDKIIKTKDVSFKVGNN